MIGLRYAALAARWLRRPRVQPAPMFAARDRGLSTIQRALAARQKRQRRRTFALAGGIGVAASLAVGLLARLGDPSGTMPPAPRVGIIARPLGAGALLDAAPLPATSALASGSSLSTGAFGGVALELSTGTGLELGSESVFSVQRQDEVQHFELRRGLLIANVVKLASQERFVIDTPDASVEVRGTRFRLRVLDALDACMPDSKTRLYVREGVVEVRSKTHTVRVTAGESWPAHCAPDPLLSDDPPPVSDAEQESDGMPAKGASSRDSGVALEGANGTDVARGSGHPEARLQPQRQNRSSTIGAQNELFAAGLHARQNGDVQAALRAYAELLRRYPSSPLAENARVERMRLLAFEDRARGRVEAARYLQRHPNGFARAEAKRLLESP